MIFSAQQIFSDDQAVTATAISTNVIDTGVRGTPYGAAAALTGDIGKGNPIQILCQVTTDFATLTSLTITVECSAAVGLTSPVVLYSSGAVLAATLVQGYMIPLQYLPITCTLRYLGIRYTVGGSSATAGNIVAGITFGNQTNLVGA